MQISVGKVGSQKRNRWHRAKKGGKYFYIAPVHDVYIYLVNIYMY